MPSTLDRILIDVAAGKPEGVEQCLNRFSSPVWSLARRYSPNDQDAEDAVQDIFVDLWRSAGRFDPEAGSALTFVMTIARRRLIDRSRKRGRMPDVHSHPEPESIADEDARHHVEVVEEAARVTDAMRKLRPEQQQVLELSLVHGRSHQQIADTTGLALGTVKSHARRGLMRVREMLQVNTDDGGGPDS
ncbi:MAG: RNA polymerase sigma factor [Planctomycetota bacterium]|jgi:RNA polymerase sigma-70 factor (ECF subfamily)